MNAPTHAPERLKVLVVDDTATNRQILHVFLKKLGFVVVLAEDGAEAVDRFSAERPDVVLMDVMMPVMDGFEATRRIKALSTDRWVPVVYLTALDKETDLVTGLDAGGDDYLTKPVSFVVLDAKLRSLQRTLALQRTLEETRRRTQAITDNIVDGVITLGEDGVIQFCNPSVLKIFGYALAELVGQRVDLLVDSARHGDHSQHMARYLAGGPGQVFGLTRQVNGRHRNGHTIPLELAVSELRFGQERLFVGIVRDISERVANEARLRDDAQRLQRYHDRQEEENTLARGIIERLTQREGINDPSLSHGLRPAANFSGDVLVAARSPEGRLYTMLGDATGHGLAAAISALPAVTVFYGMVKRNLPLAVMVAELNKHLRDTLAPGRFFAASLFCGDPHADSAELWVGGMPEVLQFDRQGRLLERFPATQLALGIIDFDAEMCATRVATGLRGSDFVFYSDGLTEADDGRGEEFGLARLTGVLEAAPRGRRLEAVKASLNLYIRDEEPRDDISLLLIGC